MSPVQFMRYEFCGGKKKMACDSVTRITPMLRSVGEKGRGKPLISAFPSLLYQLFQIQHSLTVNF